MVKSRPSKVEKSQAGGCGFRQVIEASAVQPLNRLPPNFLMFLGIVIVCRLVQSEKKEDANDVSPSDRWTSFRLEHPLKRLPAYVTLDGKVTEVRLLQ
jgi:hypothetical protein